MATRSVKLVSLAALVRRRKSWRRAGKTVVFTNGIFDILHRGHVEYLTHAKRLGDVLIVGLNSDNSTHKLKGPGRPINRFADRAAVLAGLAAVDRIVRFDELTPINLIVALQPDVLVKGAQYKKNEIVGAPEVESWGGRVMRVPMRKGLSTTRLISEAARRASRLSR